MASQRAKDDKDREDYHTNNYPSDPLIIGAAGLQRAEKAAKLIGTDNTKEEVKNFDVTFIPDDVFQEELDYLILTPQSNIVFLLGPAIKNVPTKQGLLLDERSVNNSLKEELDAIPAGMRVLAISKALPSGMVVDFKEGDYVVYQANHTTLTNFHPKNPEYAYYQVRTTEVKYSFTQEGISRFKPEE